MSEFLYVIAADEQGPVKIGLSKHPDRRLRQLQTGHACKLVLHHAEPVEDGQVRALERIVHEQIRHRRMQGEWFDLTVPDAIAEVQFVMIRYGDEPNIKTRREMGTLRL